MINLIYKIVFFFKQKTAYEMRISDWSSDVCSSDLPAAPTLAQRALRRACLPAHLLRRDDCGAALDDRRLRSRAPGAGLATGAGAGLGAAPGHALRRDPAGGRPDQPQSDPGRRRALPTRRARKPRPRPPLYHPPPLPLGPLALAAGPPAPPP